MSASQAESQMMQILIGGACLVIIVAGMRAMAHVLNIVFLAWLLAYAILPLPNWMMRHRVPEALAVLGTGPDQCYPRENRALYARIAQQGLLVSEFPPGTGPR